MYFCSQPLQQWLHVTTANAFRKVGQNLGSLCKKLGSIKAAEAVGREITKRPMAPMHILQATVFIIRNGNVQVLFILFVLIVLLNRFIA